MFQMWLCSCVLRRSQPDYLRDLRQHEVFGASGPFCCWGGEPQSPVPELSVLYKANPRVQPITMLVLHLQEQLTECSLAVSVRQTPDLRSTWGPVVEVSNSHMENRIKFDIIFPRESEFIVGSHIWDLIRCCILKGRRDCTPKQKHHLRNYASFWNPFRSV